MTKSDDEINTVAKLDSSPELSLVNQKKNSKTLKSKSRGSQRGERGYTNHKLNGMIW